MMSNSEHLSFCCIVNSANRGKGRCAFAGPLALSLFIHLVGLSACVLLNAQVHATPAKATVIAVNLSAVDTRSGAKDLTVTASAMRPGAKQNADSRDSITPIRRHPLSSEQTSPRNPEHPSPVAEPLEDPAMKIDEAHAAIDSPGTDIAAEAAYAGTAGIASESGSKGAGGLDGNSGAESGCRGGGEHQAKAALAEYSRRVRALIERHKNYPFAARKFGIRGSLVVSFSLNCRGELRCLTLAKSSGNAMLDHAGMHAVRDVGSFPPPPRHALHGEAISFRIPISFAIAAG